jgi:hypothetical protein
MSIQESTGGDEQVEVKPPTGAVRLGRGVRTMDRDFDITFWQGLDTTARMDAAWDLVAHYLNQKGRAGELRLQRTVAVLGRGRR